MSPGGGEKQEQMWFLTNKDSKSGISGRKLKGSQNSNEDCLPQYVTPSHEEMYK